ncbi:MAG: hypothetical protein AB7G88_15770, partial [Thermomicrobiales bacterium]
ISTMIASRIDGASFSAHTGDISGTPVAELCSYFSNRSLLFDIQHLSADTSLVSDAAYQQTVGDRIVTLDALARSLASASRVQRMFLDGMTEGQARSIVAANRAPRFDGQTGLIASYYKANGSDFGYFGQTPEDFAIRQALFADSPCVRGDALPIPGTQYSASFVARSFASDSDAASFHAAQPTPAQDQAHLFDRLILLADDEFTTGPVRGNYTLSVSDEGNVAGYQVWAVRNLVAYTLAFHDHTGPFPGESVDPAGENWQNLKTGALDVTQQFLAGIDSPEPWPAFTVPGVWLP